MRFSLSSSHALLEMKCDMQISYEMVSNAHVHQLTVSFNFNVMLCDAQSRPQCLRCFLLTFFTSPSPAKKDSEQ